MLALTLDELLGEFEPSIFVMGGGANLNPFTDLSYCLGVEFQVDFSGKHSAMLHENNTQVYTHQYHTLAGLPVSLGKKGGREGRREGRGERGRGGREGEGGRGRGEGGRGGREGGEGGGEGRKGREGGGEGRGKGGRREGGRGRERTMELLCH